MAALRFFFYLLMKPAALGMSFLGIVGIFTPYTDPNTWWIPAFSGLFMPVILIFNLFLLIFWAFYKKFWLIFPLLALLSNYQYYISTYQWPWKELPDYSADSVLTVASYNVEGFYWIAKNPEQYNVKQFLKEKHIDIICFQEHCEESQLDDKTIFKRMEMPYRCTYFNRQTPWANFGISIYSKYPILRYGKINFDSEQNNSMWADILVNKDTVRVFNNHLQSTDVSINTQKYNEYKSVKNWKGQARTLVNLLEQLKQNFEIRALQAKVVREIIDTTHYPAIICGDFNDTSISYSYNYILGDNFKDGFQDCGKGYGHSFNGIKRLLLIDFIAYDQHFTGLRYESPHLIWSDHNPVIMTVKIKK